MHSSSNNRNISSKFKHDTHFHWIRLFFRTNAKPTISGLVCASDNIFHSHSIWFEEEKRRRYDNSITIIYSISIRISKNYFERVLADCSKANGKIYRCGNMTMSFESKDIVSKRENATIAIPSVDVWAGGSMWSNHQRMEHTNHTKNAVHMKRSLPAIDTFCDSINWLKRHTYGIETVNSQQNEKEMSDSATHNMLRARMYHTQKVSASKRDRDTQNRQFETMQCRMARCSARRQKKNRESTKITRKKKNGLKKEVEARDLLASRSLFSFYTHAWY